MKLFTKEIDKKLFAQYPKGNNLEEQMVVGKIFNPYGNGRWFLLNSDPQDPDYLWAIVQMGQNVEIGSVSRKQLENLRISAFRFPLERDLGFRPVNAYELFKGLREGKFYKAGGFMEQSENKEMLLNQAEEIEHHVEEFEEAAKKSDHVPAWVVAKAERASTDLSDASHYLEAENEQKREEMEGEEEYAHGGEVKWQEAEYGDSALVISENKMGIIMKPYGRKFHLKFIDGTEKTYDANDLKFFKDVDDFDLGGEISKKGITPLSVHDEIWSTGARAANLGDINDSAASQESKNLIATGKRLVNMARNVSDIKYAEGGELKESGIGEEVRGFKVGDYFYETPSERGKNRFYKITSIDKFYIKADDYTYEANKDTHLIPNKVRQGYGGVSSWTRGDFEYKVDTKQLSKYNKGDLDGYSYMADGGTTSSPNTEFMKWFVDWSKSVNKYVYVSISIPNEFSSPIKDGKGKIVLLNLIEKKGDADAKKYMNEILKKADEFGVSIYLEPIPRTHDLKSEDHKKKITKDYLIKYYQKFGFENTVGGFMVREPKMAEGGYVSQKINSLLNKLEYASKNGKEDEFDKISNKIHEISDNQGLNESEYNRWDEIRSLENEKRISKFSKMADGGKVKFKDKVASIKASLLKRKKVPKVVQKDYGKTFSPAEAEDSAKRIVGAQTARERLMMRIKSKKKK